MSTIMITGCNGNIAISIIEYLASSKTYTLIGCDIQDEFDPLKKLNGFKIEYFKVDLRSSNAMTKFINTLKFKNLIPETIINNAAIDSVPDGKTSESGLNLDYFDDYYKINVKAPIFLFKLVSREWINQGISGKVVNISSIYSKVSPDPSLYSEDFIKNILYGSTKAALNNAFQQISVMFASENIRINSLILAGIESINQDETFKKQYLKRIPINRFLKVKEIFKALELLIDKSNTYMTGSEIVIDGAYTNI